MNGLIILPDEWQGLADISFTSGTGDFSQNSFTLEQWSSFESAGAVFLPAAGYLGLSSGQTVRVGVDGTYWSNTPNGTSNARYVCFRSNLFPNGNGSRRYGRSVRLVQIATSTFSDSSTSFFPDDPGTLIFSLELHAAGVDGESFDGYEPSGAGGFAKGTSVTITAQDIPGYEFVRWSDEVTDKSRTIVLNESMTLTALYNHSMIEIPIAANRWNFICLPPLGDRQYTAAMFTYDGLTGVKWGTYNGSLRASGQSGWETPETFNALQGYILYSTTAGTLRINAYEDDIRQGESGSAIYAGLTAYTSSHPENESWNFLGNPYNQGYNIAGLAAAGIESPITVWNGVGYTTYTPGIDSYILNPFEAFFIQKAEGTDGITFSREYLTEDSGSDSGVADAMGTLPGYFSISATQRIQFSKGNLQYQASTDTWRFAENQYDTIGALNANISDSYNGWIDLFGWGTGSNPTLSSQVNSDYSTFVDWGTNAISNGGNELSLWRTLTQEEWIYLFCSRTNATSLFGLGAVNGVNGTIILPDNWSTPQGLIFTPSSTQGLELSHLGNSYNDNNAGHFGDNVYNANQWSVMESVGAVFLPAAGIRSSDVNYVGSSGYYWSSTPYDANSSCNFYFYSFGIGPQEGNGCYHGQSVRLVR